MIYKRCSLCNKRIPSGSLCDCKKNRHQTIKSDKTDSFYDSKTWKRLRKKAKKYYFGLDFYAFYVYGLLIEGRTVHHIVPLEVDEALKTDFENLIYVSESSHREIHSLLENDYDATVKLLQQIRKRFIRDFYGG